jgi:uncharacterized protein YbjT (DUF2867 family)
LKDPSKRAVVTDRRADQRTDAMKNVIIIGAKARIARGIVDRLLEQGDVRLTLFSRHLDPLKDLQCERVGLVQGDATRTSDLVHAIAGQDIVVSVMGGLDLDAKTVNILDAMKKVGSRRIVVISAGGIYEELPEPFNAWDKSMVAAYRPVNLRTAQAVEQSSVAYTILRPVWLTDKPIEEFELTRKGEIFRGTETSRASVARLIADIVEDPKRYWNENLGISQRGTQGDRPAAYR